MEGESEALGEAIAALEIRSVEGDQDRGDQEELAAQVVRVLRALELRGRHLELPQAPEVLSCPQGPLVPLEQASH